MAYFLRFGISDKALFLVFDVSNVKYLTFSTSAIDALMAYTFKMDICK